MNLLKQYPLTYLLCKCRFEIYLEESIVLQKYIFKLPVLLNNYEHKLYRFIWGLFYEENTIKKEFKIILKFKVLAKSNCC